VQPVVRARSWSRLHCLCQSSTPSTLTHNTPKRRRHHLHRPILQVLQQLGKGKYGEVFEGIDLDHEAPCVVKIMRPVKEQRLKREIKILRHVRGGPNIIGLLDLVRDPDTKTPCFVFELVDAVPLRELQVGHLFWGGEGGAGGAGEGAWGCCGRGRRLRVCFRR